MAKFARIASVGAVVRAVRLATRPGGPSMGERVGALPRLARATVSGQYTGVSKGRLALMVAATGYLIAPIDLLPELFLPVVGLADDALVLSWLATRLVEETETFLEWERAGMPSPATSGAPGGTSATGGTGAAGGSGDARSATRNGATWPPPAGDRSSRPAAAQVIPGDVVS